MTIEKNNSARIETSQISPPSGMNNSSILSFTTRKRASNTDMRNDDTHLHRSLLDDIYLISTKNEEMEGVVLLVTNGKSYTVYFETMDGNKHSIQKISIDLCTKAPSLSCFANDNSSQWKLEEYMDTTTAQRELTALTCKHEKIGSHCSSANFKQFKNALLKQDAWGAYEGQALRKHIEKCFAEAFSYEFLTPTQKNESVFYNTGNRSFS